MVIRPAVSSDHGSVERLWQVQNTYHASVEPTRVRLVRECMSPDEYAAVIGNPLKEIAVVEVEGEIVGAALLIERPQDGAFAVATSIAYVQELCIAETSRRQGIGSALLSYVNSWAKKRGLSSIELRVWARNTSAMSFYRSLGFEEVRHELSKLVL